MPSIKTVIQTATARPGMGVGAPAAILLPRPVFDLPLRPRSRLFAIGKSPCGPPSGVAALLRATVLLV